MSKPLRVSWSSIRVHEECKQRSYLQREGKRAKVTNIRNFFGGMVVDRIMREWLNEPLIRTADKRALVTCTMDELESLERGKGSHIRWRNAADRDEVRDFCVELVNRLEPILAKYVLPYQYEHGKWFKVPMHIPAPITREMREILLTGEMDLLVYNDGPIVWDLKGTADDQYYRKVIAQLTFYDLAIWASSGQRTRYAGLIQPMCTEQLLVFDITDDMRRDLMARIVRYAHDVWLSVSDCTASTAPCHWCDVRHACARYAPASIDTFGDLAARRRTAAGDQP